MRKLKFSTGNCLIGEANMVQSVARVELCSKLFTFNETGNKTFLNEDYALC
jgi:hypothetical protein